MYPHLKQRLLKLKLELTPEQKAVRVRLANRLLAMEEQRMRRYLHRVIWIDSKRLYVVPHGRKVWAPKNAQLTVEDPRMPTTGRQLKSKCIFYYAAVNAVTGPLLVKLATGTTGFLEMGGRTYKVRVVVMAVWGAGRSGS